MKTGTNGGEDGIMKKSLLFAAALLALASCTREVAVEVPGSDLTLIARTEGPSTKTIVEGRKLTTLMITHNMQSALDLGNRTLMMDRGKVIYDVTGDERASLTIADLTDKFRQLSGRELDNDRMLLGTGAKA